MTALDGAYRLGPRRLLEPGGAVRISGERGTFTFIKASQSASGEISLDFVGGLPGHYAFRSFRPERVKKILPYRRAA